MRKIIFTLISFFVLTLAACSQTATPVQDGDASNLTLQEVFDKTLEASNELKSFSMDMTLEQEMVSDSAPDEVIGTVMSAKMDVIVDPMALYQQMDMEMDFGEVSQTITTETYFTEEGIYMKDSFSNQWMKFPQDMLDQIMEVSMEQTDPTAQMEQLEKFIDEFKFEQNNSEFILRLNASGNNFIEIIQELSVDVLGDDLIGDELFEGFDIEQLNYTIYIDKETFLPTKVEMDTKMSMDIMGEVMSMSQSMTGTYDYEKEIEAITIPQEIIDSAIESGF